MKHLATMRWRFAFLAAVLVAGATPAWALNTTNLIGYYRFDERDATTTARDDMGISNGTFMEFSSTSAARAVGKYRGAAEFDGANAWVKVPDVSNHLDAIATNNAFTVAAWVRSDKWSTAWSNII